MQSHDPIEALAKMRHEFGEHGGVNMSIEASTTFTVMAAELMPRIFHGERGPFSRPGGDEEGCYLYGRHFNPTVFNFGRLLGAMEGTETGYATASGMSAIACTLLQLCDAGDRIVAANTIYGGSFALLRERSVFAHCLHMDAQDRACMSSKGGAAAFCPTFFAN